MKFTVWGLFATIQKVNTRITRGGPSQNAASSASYHERVAPLPFKIVLIDHAPSIFPLSCRSKTPLVSTCIYSQIRRVATSAKSYRDTFAARRTDRLACHSWTTCCAAAISSLSSVVHYSSRGPPGVFIVTTPGNVGEDGRMDGAGALSLTPARLPGNIRVS